MIAKNSSKQINSERIDSLNNRIISDINENISNNTDIILREDMIKRKIRRLIHFGKISFRNGVKKENLEKFLWFINDLFNIFPISKVYYLNGINTNMQDYEKLPLEEMFLYNVKIKNENHHSFSVTQGGNCIHWALFFHHLLKEIFGGEFSDVCINFLTYSKQGNHICLVVRYKKTTLIIDPFSQSRSGGIIHYVRAGEEITRLGITKIFTNELPINIDGIEDSAEFDYNTKSKYIKQTLFEFSYPIKNSRIGIVIESEDSNIIFKIISKDTFSNGYISTKIEFIKEIFGFIRLMDSSKDIFLCIFGDTLNKSEKKIIEFISPFIPAKDLINFFKLHILYPPSAAR